MKKGKKGTLQWRNPTNITSVRGSRLTAVKSHVDCMYL